MAVWLLLFSTCWEELIKDWKMFFFVTGNHNYDAVVQAVGQLVRRGGCHWGRNILSGISCSPCCEQFGGIVFVLSFFSEMAQNFINYFERNTFRPQFEGESHNLCDFIYVLPIKMSSTYAICFKLNRFLKLIRVKRYVKVSSTVKRFWSTWGSCRGASSSYAPPWTSAGRQRVFPVNNSHLDTYILMMDCHPVNSNKNHLSSQMLYDLPAEKLLYSQFYHEMD